MDRRKRQCLWRSLTGYRLDDPWFQTGRRYIQRCPRIHAARFSPAAKPRAQSLTPNVQNVWAVGDRIIVRFEATATTTSGAPSVTSSYGYSGWSGLVIEAEAFLDLVANQEVIDNDKPRPE